MMAPSALIPDLDRWTARLRSWRKSGFWLPSMWGPRPSEPGCFVPAELLA